MTLASFVNGNYLIFMYCVPLALYHATLLSTKGYKVYAITREEYRPIKKNKAKCIELKIGYYAILIVVTTITLMMAATNMATYHVMGQALLKEYLKF